MHIHILGICGTFMGGVALLAKQAGHRVTGCDANVYPPMSTQLEAQGIELTEGFDRTQIGLKPDVFVIGNVITRGNPLMEEILDRGLPFVSGPQWLAENVLRGKWVLACAGTHGKTTTAAMLAWILEYAGLNPAFLIGGVPENFGVSARLAPEIPPGPPFPKGGNNPLPAMGGVYLGAEGNNPLPAAGGGPGRGKEASPFFVIEADEYDTAFFDKRSKFVHYRSRTVVLNNLEFEHADIFPDLAAIETQFHHLVRTIPRQGLIVANGADEALRRVLRRGCWTPLEYFASPEGWQAFEGGDPHRFTVLYRGEPQGEVRWKLLGEHNRQNALAALAAARHVGVAVRISIEALGRFANVKRRMEVRGVVAGITVYDDFAHHPTAIATTLAGLRGKVGGARILAVLEPRSNTMKMGVMKDRLAPSLAAADLTFCYTAGLGWDANAALAPLEEKAACFDDFERLVDAIVAEARPGDHVLVMSNGAFGGIHETLLARFGRK